ncbi:TPA: hypothetical protein I7692_20990 [Vibrio vulnificus]|nr:hypothetical protein [Vibrio vulnificus]
MPLLTRAPSQTMLAISNAVQHIADTISTDEPKPLRCELLAEIQNVNSILAPNDETNEHHIGALNLLH